MSDIKPILGLKDVSVKVGGINIFSNINLNIQSGEQWAIVGNSGSGKTTLANAITGKLFYSGSIIYGLPANHTGGVMLVEQQHRFKNLSNTNEFYYQQRFNSSDAGNSITVAEALKNFTAANNAGAILDKWIAQLHLAPLLQEPLIQLSNGENKRLQLAEALLSDPALLIMDNPFIGLDSEGRKTLHSIIDTITKSGIHIILITTPQELPQTITHIGVLNSGSINIFTKEQYTAHINNQSVKKGSFVLNIAQLKKINIPSDTAFSYAIQMKNVFIQYDDKKILDNINWEVKKSECWNISGPNGAGKSTLLSLITADNPQAYANEIYLFDKRRGKGESIWDIKRKIGYVSPELHLFLSNIIPLLKSSHQACLIRLACSGKFHRNRKSRSTFGLNYCNYRK